jgi:hypothetical protein
MPDPLTTTSPVRPPGVPTTSRAASLGRVLLVVVAAITVVVPVLLDGVVLAGAHTNNPAWLPHAKLHAAIALVGAIALGGGTLVCLLGVPNNVAQRCS